MEETRELKRAESEGKIDIYIYINIRERDCDFSRRKNP